jgi:AcrR family transcriptional regulator
MRSGGSVAVRPEDRTFIENARRAQIVKAAIDTIAELGYARTSLARIAERAGISKGVISYHFAGKDELIKEVVVEVVESGKAYMRSRISPESSGPDVLRAYIESNLAFMGEHPNYMVTIVEIGRNGLTADGERRFYGDSDIDDAVRILEDLLGRFQDAGEFRQDFDPRVMAVTIRAAIDAAPPRLAHDPQLDIDTYAREIANLFERATRPD